MASSGTNHQPNSNAGNTSSSHESHGPVPSYHPNSDQANNILESGQENSKTVLPHPSLMSRFWAKSKDITRSVLRALGLAILAHAFTKLGHLTGRGLHESVKIAIRKDRAIALPRSLIHLIPVSVSLCEIILNWNTYYVGVSIYNQAVYQLLAKVHEIAIQASLAAVVFSYIRHELTTGKGIPFGALQSGLQISQVSYLWSMEFWGTIRSVHLSLRRKFLLLMIIFTCIVVASLSGPSSAVLLVPRFDYWPAGSTDTWINTTFNDLYPTFLDASLVPDGCLLAPEQSLNKSCPSSEWESIREFLAIASLELPVKDQEIYNSQAEPGYFFVSGKTSQRQQYLGRLSGPDIHIASSSSTTQMVATADALATTATLWFRSLYNVTQKSGHGSPLFDQSDSVHTLTGDSFQGFATGNCLSEAIHNSTDTNPIAFPFLINANNPATPTTNRTSSDGYTFSAIVHPNLSRADVVTNARNSFEYQLQWVDLPQPLFNGSSIGAVIVPPYAVNSTYDNDGPQSLILCNLAAGWGSTALQTERSSHVGQSSVSSTITDSPFEPLYHIISPTAENENINLDFYYPGYPQQLINITQEWAQYLDPMVESANRSIFDLLMQEHYVLQGSYSIESLNVFATETLVLMVTNGLARISYDSTLQGSPKSIPGTPYIDGNYWLSGKGNVFTVDPVESKDWVKFHVNSTLQGYAYNTQTLPPRLAIGVLTLYCIIALAHVIYSGITGISSTCWDSITEVTTLAMNSTPTKTLRNTCAGITELHIFQLPVRMFARPDDEGDGEHLELVFGDKETDGRLIKANRAYGTMPRCKCHVE